MRSSAVVHRRRRSTAPAVIAFLLSAVAVLAPGSTALAASPAPTPSAAASPKANVNDPAKVTFGIGPAGKVRVNDAGVIKSILGIDGRPYFYYSVTPGVTFTDHVAVVNIAFKPLTLSVYASDALNGADGSFGLEPASKKPADAGRWVSLTVPGGGTHLVVPARSTVVLPVTISVPRGASPGDHTAGLVASLQSQAKTTQGDIVTLDQRVGARMFIRVSGALRPQLTVENLSAQYHGTLNPFGRGTVSVTYTVRNTGNLRLAGHQRVAISGLFGSSGAATAIADVPLLLPGGSMRVSVEVRDVLPEIFMSATVTVSPLVLSGDVDPNIQDAVASTHFWAIPWTLLVLLLVIAGYLYWRIRRRRRGAEPESGGAVDDVRVPEGVTG